MASSLPLPLTFYHIFAQTGVPVLFGAMINCPLFGITVAQTIWYYRYYPKDSIFHKACVLILLAMDAIQTGSILEASKLVYLRGQILTQYPRGLVLDLYFACLTVTMVQGAFAYRVFWMSNKNWILTAILVFLTLCQCSAGIGMAIIQQINDDISALHTPISTALGNFEFSSTVLCDLLISVSLAYYLNKCRSGIRRTNNLVDTLIIYVVGIGLLTTIFAILVFVTWIAIPEKLIFFTFHSIISKLYVNSLLVTLNARSSLRSPKDDSTDASEINLSALGSGSSHSIQQV